MKKSSRFLSLLLACVLAIGSFSFGGISVSASTNVLFEETFDEGYESKTAYNGKTGAWSYTDGSANLSRNSDDGEGKIYAARNQASAMQFKFDDGQEYTDVMKLKVTADILTGPTDKDSCRVDIIGSIESDGHHRVTLCNLSGGKFYVNTMGTAAAYDTGATYEAATRYIVEGIIDEANKTFTVSIYEKDTGDVVLENYNVTPYDHEKSNWYEITHGLKGVYFRADRTGNGSPAYSLYSIKVEEVLADEEEAEPWTVSEGDITLSGAEGTVMDWGNVPTALSTVEIDFGEAMDDTTLTDNTVYIENTETNDTIEYTPDYESNVYTMTLGEELVAGDTYNIVITTDVTSAAGGKNAEDVVFSFTAEEEEIPGPSGDEISDTILFRETFDEGYESKTTYNGKTGAWSYTDGSANLSRNSDGGEGKIYAARNQASAMQFKFDDGQEYTDVMTLKVTADILTGPTDKDSCRVDVIGSIESDGHHRVTLCSLSGGKFYVNTMGTTAARDTGATYEANKRYIVEGIIDEENKTFTVSVKEKDTGVVVLNNFNVDPYKHDKSNWYEITHGLKGVYFKADRTGNGSPAYSLYSILVEKVVEEAEPWTVSENDITLSDAEGTVYDWENVPTALSTVEIDFGEAMNDTTLTENTIYIENTETNDTVEYTPDYESNVYTMTLGEELVAGDTYNIVITTDVTSAAGGKNAEDVVFSFTAEEEEIPGPSEDEDGMLFSETFDEGFGLKTTYSGKTGLWSNSDNEDLVWDNTGDEGKIYANSGEKGGLQFKLDDGQEYSDVMVLEVTAEILAGSTDSTDYGRVDVIGSIESDGHHRISLCSFYGGKIYANCMINTETRYTGGTYEAGKMYIVKGVIDEANETFKLSVYDKETGSAIIENYVVTPFKHDKSNWHRMTKGFKGVNFFTDRTAEGELAYSLCNLSVKELQESDLTISESNITITDRNENVQAFDSVSILANKISVDFGMPMNGGTLSASNIYVERASDGKKVSYTSTYRDNVYTMNLTSILEAETDYNIVFGSTIKTADDIEYGKETAIPFTTASNRDALESDNGYDRTFDFADLTNWSKVGKTDSYIAEGKLTVPNTTTGERMVTYQYNPVYKEHMILEVTYDISAGIGSLSRLQIDGNQGYIVLATFNGGYIYANTYTTENSTGVTYEEGKTYTVKCIIDQFEGILNITVYDEDGVAVVSEFADAPFGGNNGRGANIVGLKSLAIVNNIISEGATAPAIDNLTIREVLLAPEVSSDDITIGVVGGETAANFKDVNPASNIVTVGMGTIIDTATLTDENVQILKNGTPINTTIAYSDRAINIIIHDVLSAKTEYTIRISGDVANLDGIKMGNDAEFKFTTGVASVSAAINKVSVNDTLINNMAQIANGDNMVIDVDYTNSTGEDQTLHVIVAGYSDDALVRANYITKDVDKSITKSTIKVESGEFNTEGVEEVMVMLWDGFDTMHPLSPCVSFR